jgi:PAS domain S-box-containing protein
MGLSMWLVVALALGAVACYLGLAQNVWRHRELPGGRPLALVLLAIGIWTVCYGLELSSTLPEAKFWSGLKYLGVSVLPPALLTFALRYTGRWPRIPPGVIALLAIEPVAVMTLLAIPATHDLIHFYPADARFVGRTPIAANGPLFWVHAGWNYGLTVLGVGLLISRLVRVAPLYRPSAALVIGTSLLPFAGNIVYALSWTEVDPTPFLFTLSAAMLVWGFFRLRLLDLMPVARAVVVETMTDAVLVLDGEDRMVDTNPAAETMLGMRRAALVGRPVLEVVPELAGMLARHRPGGAVDADLRLFGPGGRPIDVALTVSTMAADPPGRHSARVLVLRDITERKQTEQRLRELLREQGVLVDVLHASLRPTLLPEVPGAVLAARSLPSSAGGGVGGDFYDVHPAAAGRWAFVIGDVSGQGVHAAVVTSIARYTVRTLSAQGWSPGKTLEQLNRALLSAQDVERFCTILYGLAEPRGDGLHVALALGGHPLPLLRRRGGSVTPVGEPGTVLGLLPEVELPETAVDLRPGDVLLAYTDGVTEARRDGEEFGEQRLAAVLAAAGGGPQQVADTVLLSVTDWAAERDDVAVLVLGVPEVRPGSRGPRTGPR